MQYAWHPNDLYRILFLTKYSIINFTDAEERFFILSFFVITSDIFTVFCFFQIDLFL